MERDELYAERVGLQFRPDAVIMGGGDFPTHALPLAFLEHRHVVCCDGAANRLLARQMRPWRVVGDGDSLSAETRRELADIIRIFPDQETNDQTKAVKYLQQKGMRKIAIVAATGRREDHTLGNISLLMEYLHMGLEVRIYTDYGVFIPCSNSRVFEAETGAAVSVFGFGTHGMKSEGLAYPLYDFTSWWQGTLNHTTASTFSISCRGEYLVYLNYENKKIAEV